MNGYYDHCSRGFPDAPTQLGGHDQRAVSAQIGATCLFPMRSAFQCGMGNAECGILQMRNGESLNAEFEMGNAERHNADAEEERPFRIPHSALE